MLSAQEIRGLSKMPPKASMAKAIRRGFEENPFKLMMIGGDRILTYAKAYRWANAFAWHLYNVVGVDKGSTVVVSLTNVIEFPPIIAALQVLNIRVALLSGTAEKHEFRRAIKVLKPSVVIVGTPQHCDFVRELAPDVHLMVVRCPQVDAPHVEDLMYKSVSFAEGVQVCDEEFDADIILFSSGTTGNPKAIVNHSSSFQNNARKLTGALGVGADDVLYVPVPFSHVYGFLGIYAALERNATLVTGERYTPESSLNLLMNARVTVYFGVTTMYLREMRINADNTWDLSSLRLGMVAGASCPEAALVEYESRYGCTLVQSYGMTETAATLTVCDVNDPPAIRATSVGVTIPDVQLKIDESNGEILCKTPSMMTGMILDDGFKPTELTEDGWFRSGDVGEFDDEGRLYVTGRIKDLVIRGGINIFPAEIENAYQPYPNISECCLVGYPDPELGERTCLCVVLKNPDADSSYDLRQYAKGRIEKCKIPDTVLKMAELPHLPNGKLNKNQLREDVKKILQKTGKPQG